MSDEDGISCSPDGSKRPSHKQVEQYRRMKAREYFEELRDLLPASRETRCDRNKILQEAIEYVKELQGLIPPRNRDDDEDGLQFEMEEEACKKEIEDTKHLSHNQVEQRRRQLAKSHFDELRALLPDAGKYDKNTVLLHIIQLIRKLTGKEDQSATSSPSPTNLSRSAPAPASASWRSQQSTVAAESSCCGLSGLSRAASSLSSSSELCDLLSTSVPEGSASRNGRKRSPTWLLGFDQGYERKRRVSDVLEDDAACLKQEGDTSCEEVLAFQALTLLSECAERLSLESAHNTPASTPKIAPMTPKAGGAGGNKTALEMMSLTALCS